MTVLNACNECAELKLDDMDITHLGYDTFTSVGADLKYLDLDNNFIELSSEGSEFRGISSLKTLELSGNAITQLSRNMFQHVASSLRALYLESNLIETIDPSTFLDFQDLKTLSLRDNIIQELNSDNFQGLENVLITLNLAENSIRRINANAFSRLVTLEQLELYHNRLLNVTMPRAFDGLTNLLELWISESVLPSLDGVFDCSDGVSPMPNAKSLILSGGALTYIGAHTFANVSSISSLYLNGNKIKSLHVDAFYDLASLKVLDLSENAITQIPANIFVHIPNMQGLSLNDNLIDSISSRTFAGLDRVHLKQLQLENNDIATFESNTFDGIIDCNEITWTMYNNPSICECSEDHTVRCNCAPYLQANSNGCVRSETVEVHATCMKSGCQHVANKKSFQNCEQVGLVSGDLQFGTMGGDHVTISGLSSSTMIDDTSSWKLITSATANKNSVMTSCVATGTNVSCVIPSGAGKRNSVTLQLNGKDTDILSGCTFDYAEPQINVLAGCTRCRDSDHEDCDEDPTRPTSGDAKAVTTVNCDRVGSSRIALYGQNFGFDDALVFINGVPCNDVTHAEVNNSICGQGYASQSEALSIKNMCENCASGPVERNGMWVPCSDSSDGISPHTMLTCSLPSLQFSQARSNTVSIVQSNLFGLSHGLFRYEECEPGYRQYSHQVDDITTYVGCEICDAGLYSSLEDETYCHSCPGGTYSLSGASACITCPQDTFSAPPENLDPSRYVAESGASACLDCPSGKKAQRGSDRCEPCDFIHLGSPHCNSPVMAIILGVLLVLVGSFFTYRTYRRSQGEVLKIKKTLDMKSMDMQLMRAAWNIDWNQIDLGKREPIASGSYGAVYRGVLSGKFEIAVKIFYRMPGNEEDVEETNDEIRFLQRARHPRLVHFLGSGKTDDENRYLFVVMEFMEEGTLSDRLWIKSNMDFGIPSIPSWTQRVIWMVDVASGLTYLHLIHKSIHRDLKSPNVLLTKENGELRAKVADFGLTKILSPESSVRVHHEEEEKFEDEGIKGVITSGEGTIQWMSPEIIESISDSKVVFTQAVDVYAFGIMLWETIFLAAPWNELKWNAQICENVANGKRPTISTSGLKTAPDSFVELMFRCWAQRPQDRPRMDECLDILQTVGIHLQEEPEKSIKVKSNHHRNASVPLVLSEARSMIQQKFNTMIGKITHGLESKEDTMSIPLVDVKSGDDEEAALDCEYDKL